MEHRERQVFISYQRADHAFARRVREHLADAGVQTWMDLHDIPVGAYWPDEIDKGLVSSDIVVGVLSPDAVESRNVKNEWDWALQNDKPLLLLQFRPCVVPHRYVSINFIDATAADPASALDALLRTLGQESVTTFVSETGPTAEPPPIRHSRRSEVRRRRPEPILVGRDPEQATLRRVFDDVLAGHGSLVLLAGEAGAGKTTLTNWLAWLAEERGALALTGGSYDLSTPRPYQPWAEVIWNWPDDPGFPAAPDDLRSDDGFVTVRSQAALIELLATFLADASAYRPLVVQLEDLQWADQASLDLLRALARLIDGARILIVATYRDDELTRRHALYSLLPGLAREPNAHRITLARLPLDETRRLIATRYALPVADINRLADYVHTLAEGNPFFSGEVLQTLEDSGALVQDVDGWQLVHLEQVQVPPLVRQVIDARLEHMSDETRGLLQVAAVIGHEVPVETWAAISGASDDALSDALEQALEAHIVEEQRNGAQIRFTHALIRETLYEGLVSIRRRSWHRKVAEALIEAPRPDPDAVAYHFRQAGDERAYEWLIRAGERAERSFAWSMAAERFEAALDLLGDRQEVLAERGRLLYRIGYLLRYTTAPQVASFNAEALAIARQTGDRALEALALFQSGTPRLSPGDAREADALMRAAVHLFDALTPDERASLAGVLGTPSGQPVINDDYGMLVHLAAGYRPAPEVLSMGLEYIAALPADPGAAFSPARTRWADVFVGAAAAASAAGQVNQARSCFERGVDAFRRLGDNFMVLAMDFTAVPFLIVPFLLEDIALRRAVVAEMTAAYAGAVRAGQIAESAFLAPLSLYMAEGHWDEFLSAADTMINSHIVSIKGWSSVEMADVLRARGRLDEAFDALEPYLPTADVGPDQFEYQELWVPVMAQLLAAQIDLDRGDAVEARRWLAAHDRWRGWWQAIFGQVASRLTWARLSLLDGDPAAAESHARAGLDLAEAPRQPLGLIAAHRMLGELLTEAGRFDEAAEHLSESRRLAHACEAPFELALTLVALAALHLATGAQPDAADCLADARAICEPLGAEPTLQRIAVLEARLG